MFFLTATQSTWFLIGPIAKVLGYLMNGIFEFLNLIGIPNIGLAIILFTIIIKALMLPLSIRQQKFSKLQSVMAPELQAIQKKYQGKSDNASVLAQQEETKEVYAKYGTSATGGCVQLLIQMPILFALYQVIYKLPGYITRLKGYYSGIAEAMMNISGYAENAQLLEIVNAKRNITADLLQSKDGVIDFMYSLSKNDWTKVLSVFNDSALTNAYNGVAENINRINYFLGIELSATPWDQMLNGIWWAALIPILAGIAQFATTKLTSAGTTTQQNDDTNPMGSSMKTMNVIFPIMSVVFCFMFSAGIGIYWVASAVVQLIIQLIVNNYVNKLDINEMVKQNIEKMNEKRAKQGLPPKKFTEVISAQSLEEQKQSEESSKKTLAELAATSSAYYESHTTAKPGSLAAKAGMVQQYEERMKDKKAGKKE